jgi:hypothetical protein
MKEIFHILSNEFSDTLKTVLYSPEYTSSSSSNTYCKDTNGNIHEVRHELKMIENKNEVIDCINLSCLIQALLLISFNIKYTGDLKEDEKIILLFEKMTQSRGPSKSHAKTGRTL